jgi:hypothetical protein
MVQCYVNHKAKLLYIMFVLQWRTSIMSSRLGDPATRVRVGARSGNDDGGAYPAHHGHLPIRAVCAFLHERRRGSCGNARFRDGREGTYSFAVIRFQKFPKKCNVSPL